MTTGVLAEILGPDGLIVIVVLAMVMIFGGSQLPKLARGIGSASREFRKGLEHGEQDQVLSPIPTQIPNLDTTTPEAVHRS